MPRFDLPTLYALAIGTLVVAVGAVLWEWRGCPARRRELALWAGGFALLAAGCATTFARDMLPGAAGWAAANMLFVTGYLLLWAGLATLNGVRRRRVAAVVIAVPLLLALLWWLFGSDARAALWTYVGSAPVALAGFGMLHEARRATPARPLRAGRVVAAVAGVHAAFYAARALLLPLLAGWSDGAGLLAAAAQATMYEGVLFSAAMPMALLALVREEAGAVLSERARTDYLTGLGNRQCFFEDGARLLAGTGAAGPSALLAFDLDHFKSINDCFGHAAGDAVLRSFAAVARDVVGGRGLVVRLGGEEFAALLPGVGAADARRIGETVARRFAGLPDHGDALDIRATVSIGLAEGAVPGHDLAALLHAADRALYRAKSCGRNRIEAAPPAMAA